VSKETKKTTEDLSEEDLISKLKAKHGKIFAATCFMEGDEDQPKTLYLKKPSMITRKAAAAIHEAHGEDESAKVYMKDMYIGGDSLDEVIADDEAFLTLKNLIIELILPKTGKLIAV